MTFRVKASCVCNTGRVRRNNEDNFYFDGCFLEEENTGLAGMLSAEQALEHPFCAAVFDGVGGENFGEKASWAAAVRMAELMRAHTPLNGAEDLAQLAQELNLAVVREKEQLLTDRMGSTLAGILLSGNAVLSCNLGDSRVYRARQGELLQISRDHTDDSPASRPGKAAITQYLGVSPEEMRLEPFVFEDELRQGDRYLVCSDGLTDMLPEGEIAGILAGEPDTERALSLLLEGALQRGGRDNVTILLADIGTEPLPPARNFHQWLRSLMGPR